MELLGQTFLNSWYEITAWVGVLDIVVTVVTIAWALTLKKDSTSAVAWCLLVIFLPLIGALLFYIFGYQHVHRPIARKARQKRRYRRSEPEGPPEGSEGVAAVAGEPLQGTAALSRLARRFDGFPATRGNHVTLFHEGAPAFAAKFAAIEAARHHVHLEYFIVQPDDLGQQLITLLARKAREGVAVRLIYDAMGSHRLGRAFLRPLLDAGGQAYAFLPLAPLQRRIQINMRNHRKILVVDGQVGFTGGLNVGDEYLGKVARYGFWRDTHLRVEGPAVASLQRVFLEDWDFASGEQVRGGCFPAPRTDGPVGVQVIASGPDEDLKGIREVYFASILEARQRVWIATPYFVPDRGLLDALRLAAARGVEVRLLGLFQPDKWLPYFAGRYYWEEMLSAGVHVYQYTGGMMHAKVVMVDGQWASVGTANFDNRSLYLNFEVNCLIDTPAVVAELETAFRHDLARSVQLRPAVFGERPFTGRLLENACRLLSPVL